MTAVVFKMVNGDGEVVGSINEGDRIVRSESIEFLKSTVEWGKDANGNNRPFVKLFIDCLPQIAMNLTGGAAITILRLSEFVNYKTGMLARSKGGRPITHDDIQVMMGYSDKQVKRIMTELVDKKVLFRGRTGKFYQYYANPNIIVRGIEINKTLESMFADYE